RLRDEPAVMRVSLIPVRVAMVPTERTSELIDKPRGRPRPAVQRLQGNEPAHDIRLWRCTCPTCFFRASSYHITPQYSCARYVSLPPITVSRIFVLRIRSGGPCRMSSERMTKWCGPSSD